MKKSSLKKRINNLLDKFVLPEPYRYILPEKEIKSVDEIINLGKFIRKKYITTKYVGTQEGFLRIARRFMKFDELFHLEKGKRLDQFIYQITEYNLDMMRMMADFSMKGPFCQFNPIVMSNLPPNTPFKVIGAYLFKEEYELNKGVIHKIDQLEYPALKEPLIDVKRKTLSEIITTDNKESLKKLALIKLKNIPSAGIKKGYTYNYHSAKFIDEEKRIDYFLKNEYRNFIK